MKNYNYLIFDLDDTLLDFKDTERQALERVFEKYKIPFEEETIAAYKTINKRLWSELEKGLITKDIVLNTRFELFFKAYGYSVDGAIVEKEYRKYLNLGHKLLPKAFETLTCLKERGYTLFAGTNGVGHTQRQRLADSKLIELFEDLFISEEIGAEKPNIKFFETIFNTYPSIKKGEILMIGDSLSSDIKGAYNAGIDSVWFNPNNQKPGEIQPTYEINDLEELTILSI